MYLAIDESTGPVLVGKAVQAADMIEQAFASSLPITKDDDLAMWPAYRELRSILAGSSTTEGDQS
jgi:hypothetical protein